MKKLLNFDNRTVEINIFGKGKNIFILLPGWTHDFQYEKEFVSELAKKSRVITISYPGYSQSQENPKAQSVEFLTFLVERIIKKLHVNTFTLVGFSMGCSVALQFLKEHPKQKAILISPVMHSLVNDTPWYGKVIISSPFLINAIRNAEPIKKTVVNMASSRVATVMEGTYRPGKFESSFVSLNGAYDTLIATVKTFIDPLDFTERVKFIFGEHEVARKELDRHNFSYAIIKDSGHSSLSKYSKQIADAVLSNN